MMSNLMEITQTALAEENLHTYKYAADPENVIRLNVYGSQVAIGVDGEREIVRIQCVLSLGLTDEAKLQQAYQMVNQWNMENQTKYYMDSDGDLVLEWNMDADGGLFGKTILMAGLARVSAGLREAKAPIMKLCYC